MESQKRPNDYRERKETQTRGGLQGKRVDELRKIRYAVTDISRTLMELNKTFRKVAEVIEVFEKHKIVLKEADISEIEKMDGGEIRK